MIRRAAAVLVVLLLLVALLGAVGGLGRKPPVALAAPSQTVVASLGQAGEVRCPAGQLTVQFATGPLRWRCGPKPSPSTTTTTAPAPSTTTSSTTVAPTTSTSRAPTTTTSTTVATTTTTTVARTTSATSPPTTVTTVPVSSNGAPASLMPDSVFNQPASATVLSGSATMVADIVTESRQYNVGVNTMPIYQVPALEPLATVTVSSGCGDFLASTGSQVPIPSYANLNGSSDDPLGVYQPSTGEGWEFWQLNKTGTNTYSACWGGGLSLSTTDGVFAPNFGLAASGISYLATAITEADVASGSIDHAMAIEIDGCYSPGSPAQPAAPADRTDCDSQANSKSGEPNEGTWLRWPASLAMPGGLTPYAQMVFRAGQTYGFVVTDYAGAVMLQGEQMSDWATEGNSGTDPITKSWAGQAEYSIVASLPWSSLEAVAP